MASLSNVIDAELKQNFDQAVAGTEFKKKTVLSAAVDQIIKRENGYVVGVDEDSFDLAYWREQYE